MPMNVSAAITPAMNYTGHILFRPFVLRNWLALGFVALFAESGGGIHGNIPSSDSSSSSEYDAFLQWIMHNIALVVVGFIVLFIIGIALAWVGSVLKFVYLNQITRDPKAIREPFSRFISLGTSYFLWELALGFTILLAIGILIGIPAALLFPLFHTATAIAIIGIVFLVILAVVLIVAAGVISVIGRDFALTTMYVRNIKIMEAWQVVMPIVRANAGQTALYMLLLIAYSFIAAIGGMLIVLAVGIAFLIPGGLLALIGYGIYTACGSTWAAPLIAYAALIGSALLFAFIYAATCAMQPLLVFRRTFALIVLGQADPSLATVPTYPNPGTMPGEGISG